LMADDSTTIIKFETENLATLKNTLEDFATVSGLTCNFSKTSVMPVGPPTASPVDTVSFPLTDKIKLLGLEISNDLGSFDYVFNNILEKIENIINSGNASICLSWVGFQ
jgi:hypothetical protein